MRTRPPLCNLKTLHRRAPQVARWGRRFFMTALAYQDVPARIEKLKAHLKSRRGRRDMHARAQLARMHNYLRNRATLCSMDNILRTYYTVESVRPDRASPVFAFLKKEP